LGVAAWLATAALLYRSFLPKPFDIMDFPEFLPILQGPGSILERLGGIFSYYGTQGRFKPVDFSLLALKWSIFGASPLGWQIASFAQMSVFGFLMFAVVRRLGATVLSAALASSLALCSLAAAHGWIRLSVSEEIGASLLFGAMLLASRLNASARPRTVMLGVCACVTVMLLLKEMLVASVPAVVLAALIFDDEGRPAAPRVSRRAITLTIALGLTCVLVLLPVLIVLLNAQPGTYARNFGSGGASIGKLLAHYAVMLVPFVPAGPTMNVPVLLADISFAALLFVGWKLLYARRPERRYTTTLLAFGVLVPMLGALAYLPWPKFDLFYGIPYLLGPAVLVAFAISGVQTAAPRYTPVAVAAWLWTSVYMASDSLRYARQIEASVATVVDVSRGMRLSLGADSAEYAVCGLSPAAWRNLPPLVAGYAAMEGHRIPTGTQISCDEAWRHVRDRPMRRAVVIVSDGSPRAGAAYRTVVHTAARIDWERLRLVRDTVRADIHAPGATTPPQ
jgi:hypothetical protein